MKHTPVLTLICSLLFLATLTAQITPVQPTQPVDIDQIGEVNPEQAASGNIQLACASDPCPCSGGYRQIQVYYFGPNNVTVRAASNGALNNVFATFNNVNNGQLLTISGATLPGGQLAPYTYLTLTDGGEDCTTRLHTRCPKEGWPGALDDLAILGKTFRNFTVYSITDAGNLVLCDINNADQDWHVGGNIVGSAKNTLGTRNNENVVLITNDVPRGIMTNTGNFGLGTQAPTARLHVNGSTIVEQNLDVNGLARVNNVASSTTAANGALTVAGGAGIGENLNVGQNAVIGGTARVNSNAGSNDVTTGALVVAGGVGIGQNLNVNGNGFINGRLNVGTTNTPGLIDIVNTSNYSMFVADGILSEEVLVSSGWADFVFEKDYPLKSLEEVERVIAVKGSLPDMPTAAEIEKNGLKLGECAVQQQIKIEELFLYVIQLNNEIKQLKAEKEAMAKKIEQLEKQ